METQNGIPRLAVVALVVAGAIVGGAVVEYWRAQQASTSTAAQTSGGADNSTEVERLKTLVPSQSHGMADVGYHWTNLGSPELVRHVCRRDAELLGGDDRVHRPAQNTEELIVSLPDHLRQRFF